MKIVVLVSGGGTNLQAVIDQIASGALSGTEITGVISSSPGAYALERARMHKIPSIVISKKELKIPEAYDRAMLSAITDFGAELVVLAGFLSLLGPEVVREYSNRIINIHPSLIPAFCGHGMYGIRPHEAAIRKGVKVSGATVHFVNEDYDEGPILLQRSVEVFEEDTPESLQRRIMLECEQVILPAAIRLIVDRRVVIRDNRTYILPKGIETSEGKA